MWKKVLAFAVMLSLIILLDPTQTPAQRQDGGKGGGGGGFGFRPPTPEESWDRLQKMTNGDGTTLDISKIPEDMRAKMRDMTLKFGGNPLPDSGTMSRGEFLDHSERSMAQVKEKMASGGFNPGGNKGGDRQGGDRQGGDRQGGNRPPGGSEEELIRRFDEMDKNKDGKVSFDEAGNMTKGKWKESGRSTEDLLSREDFLAMWSGPGGPRPNDPYRPNDPSKPGDPNDPNNPAKKPVEEERPVAIRFGKLPKGLPDWFGDNDTDQDGQVGLYEWRKAGKAMAEFTEMDLNGDGYVTAEEYLRFGRQKNIDTKIANYEETGVKPGSWGLGTTGPGSPGAGSDTKSKGGPGGPFGPGGPGGPFGPGGPKGGDSGTDGNSTGKTDGGKKENKGNPWFGKKKN